MKKLFIISLLLLSFVGFSNNESTQTAKNSETNANLTEVIKPYISKWLKKADEGAEFIIDETPIVIKQYVLFEATIHLLLILLGISFLTIFRRLCKRFVYIKSKEKPNSDRSHIDFRYMGNNRWFKFDKDEDHEYTFQQVVVVVIDVLFILIGSTIILVNIADTIMAVFYPKLYLVDKFFYLIT